MCRINQSHYSLDVIEFQFEFQSELYDIQSPFTDSMVDSGKI